MSTTFETFLENNPQKDMKSYPSIKDLNVPEIAKTLNIIFKKIQESKDPDELFGKIQEYFNNHAYNKSKYSLNKNVNELLYGSFGFGLLPDKDELSDAILADIRKYNEDIDKYPQRILKTLSELKNKEL